MTFHAVCVFSCTSIFESSLVRYVKDGFLYDESQLTHDTIWCFLYYVNLMRTRIFIFAQDDDYYLNKWKHMVNFDLILRAIDLFIQEYILSHLF